jgi:lysophospholipase L1-like esterase
LLWVLLCLGAAEGGARAFWRVRSHVPLRHPSRILYAFYPGLREAAVQRPAPGDGFYDVLLLGGSTLHRDWGPVEQALAEQLAEAGHRNVRVLNLAFPAHTSRDSRLKYAALGEARFDLVVVYDGINDVRANNAPPELFREDYGHFRWYEMVNALAPYQDRAWLALPYTIRYLGISLRQILHPSRYVPSDEPRPSWTQYGAAARSVASFAQNLEAILDLAARRGDRVVLMTFAVHVPQDYSLEAFEGKRLDYVLHRKPIEDWGRPQDVLKAVAAQNEVVRRLAARHPEALLVDQAGLMDETPRFFNDPCHLTVAGAMRFAADIVSGVGADPREGVAGSAAR